MQQEHRARVCPDGTTGSPLLLGAPLPVALVSQHDQTGFLVSWPINFDPSPAWDRVINTLNWETEPLTLTDLPQVLQFVQGCPEARRHVLEPGRHEAVLITCQARHPLRDGAHSPCAKGYGLALGLPEAEKAARLALALLRIWGSSAIRLHQHWPYSGSGAAPRSGSTSTGRRGYTWSSPTEHGPWGRLSSPNPTRASGACPHGSTATELCGGG